MASPRASFGMRDPLLLSVDEEEPTPNLTPAWLVLFVLSGVAFTGNALISLIGPFLPQHFGEIGISQIWSGVIFSGFPVAMLISSPIAMSLMGRFGRVKVLVCGLVLQGLSSAAFGFADTATGGVGVNPQGALVVYVISRLVCGVGGALANNAIFSISVDRFPDALGRVMSLNEVLIGVGFSVGPPIGSVLYLAGGFGFPFYAAGAAVLAFAPFALMLTQPPVQSGGNGAAGKGEGGGLFAVMTPGLLAPAMSLFFATSVFGVVNSNLSLYLENEVGISESGIGNMFSVLAASYAVNGMLVGGPVLDRLGAPPICAAGGLFAGLLLAFGLGLEAGNLPKGSHARIVYLVVVLAALGLAQAMTLVPSLPSMHASLASESPGSTDAIVAWFNIFLQLGLAVSPIVGTAMVGAIGFERTMTVCGGVIAAYGAFALCYAIRHPAKKHGGDLVTPPKGSIGFITPSSPHAGMSSPRRRHLSASGLVSPGVQV